MTEQNAKTISHDRATPLVLCLAVMVLASIYLAPLSLRRCIPYDDGMLAQAAQRVLEGQLPHRDFDEIYSGGLTFLHALAFRVAGSSLATLRGSLFVAAIASLPAWYYVALRFGTPVVAALATLTCFVWSVPIYPASMPSWYNLILAICAVACAMKYMEDGSGRWIFLAGVIAGLSTLIKIAGLYLLAGLLLFVTFQLASTDDEPDRRSGLDAFAVLVLMGIAALLTYAPFGLIRPSFDSRDAVELALPASIVSAAVFFHLARRVRDGWRPRFASVARNYCWLGAGFVAPVLLFLIPYWLSGSLAALWRGVFVLPQLRLNMPSARMVGPALPAVAAGLPLLWLLTHAPKALSRNRSIGVTAIVVFGIGCMLALRYNIAARALWLPLRMAVLPLAAFTVITLIRGGGSGPVIPDGVRRLAVVVIAASWCALIQFPFNAPIYFCYVAPLVIMGLLASLRVCKLDAAIPPILVICLVFGVGLRAHLNANRYRGGSTEERFLSLSRARIWLQSDDHREYSDAVSLLREHARSQYTLALPDLPGLYFLSGLRNPTRTLYDAFDVDAARDRRLLDIIDSLRIQAIVVNRRPPVSDPISRSLSDSLERRFPLSKSVGGLEVRWRS